ncbi:MAG: hypothetical protein VX871_00380 [Pseudomonadota bacterium]|nr:hypothetical protein [Pseudomonadota bacterium]
MVTKLLASLLGLAFLAVAALGVIPNEFSGPDKLLNFSMAHSVIHFVFGLFLLFGVWLAVHPKLVLRTLGLLYVAVAVIGADAIGARLVDLFNGVDVSRWLELSLALLLVILGFMAGGLANRKRAVAARQNEATEEEAAPDKSWARAEARETPAALAGAAAASAAQDIEVVDDSHPASREVARERLDEDDDAVAAVHDGEPEDEAGRAAAKDEADKPESSRGFSLFGTPKPQPQN